LSFTLRQISRQAGGGEIVRTRAFEAAAIVLGRGADCDIQIPDLALALRHLTLTSLGGGRVRLEALGPPVEVDGSKLARAEFAADQSPVLTLGEFRLAIGRGEGTGETALTLTKADGDHDDHEDEAKVFALRASVFGKRRTAWVAGLAVLVLCLVLPVAGFMLHANARIHPDHQWSAGPLSKSHAFLENDCAACHQAAFVAVGDAACLSCHQAGRAAEAQAAAFLRVKQAGSPFEPRLVMDHAAHDRLMFAAPLPDDWAGKAQALLRRTFHRPSDTCASCHLEHLSATGVKPTVNAPPAPKPILAVVNDCAACHAKLQEHVRGTPLRDTPDWTRHPDFRPLVTLAAGNPPTLQRIAMADHPREDSGLKFPHRMHLSATGYVARMSQELGAARGYGGTLDCASCHHGDGDGRGFKPVQMERDCGACHSLGFAKVGGVVKSLPHGHPDQVVAALTAYFGGRTAAMPSGDGRRLPGIAAEAERARELNAAGTGGAAGVVRAVFAKGGICAECHTVLAPSAPGSLAYGIAPVSLSGRFLPRSTFDHAVPAHRQDALGMQTCTSCHAADRSDDAHDLMLPRIADCDACHGKDKTPAVPAAAAADCGECHSYHAPNRAAPDREAKVRRIAWKADG
jgi:hypothetical protein